MKKFQCYNDFKNAIKQESLPNIDEELMINKIYSRLDSKPRYNNFKIASIIISFILLTTGSIAIAKNVCVYLFNDKGEKVFTVGKLSDERMKKNEEIDNISSNYRSVLESVEKNTKAGEGSLVLIAKEYEIDYAWHPFQNNKYKTIEELKKVSLNKFKLPVFPKGIYVNDISVNFKVQFDEEYITGHEYLDKLYKECIAANKDYIVGSQKLTNDVEYVRLHIYTDDNYSIKDEYAHNILFEINRHKACISSNFDENNVEKVKIGLKEAILQKNITPYITTYDITYVDNFNNENFTYTLRGFHESEKDLVIEIIKSLQ